MMGVVSARMQKRPAQKVPPHTHPGDIPPSFRADARAAVARHLTNIVSGLREQADGTGQRLGALVESAVTQTQFISPKVARRALQERDWKTLDALSHVEVRRSVIAFKESQEYPPEIRSFFYNNRIRVRVRTFMDRSFFGRLSRGQEPIAAYIGCVDSRFDIHRMLGTAEGEMLVDRNVANVVDPNESSMDAFLTVALDTFHIPHVIVCGHVGCGGIKLALSNKPGAWFDRIRAVYDSYREELAGIKDQDELYNVVAALNVREQVLTLAASRRVQEAWERGQEVNLYGWVYGINTGYINDIGVWIRKPRDLEAIQADEENFRNQLLANFGSNR